MRFHVLLHGFLITYIRRMKNPQRQFFSFSSLHGLMGQRLKKEQHETEAGCRAEAHLRHWTLKPRSGRASVFKIALKSLVDLKLILRTCLPGKIEKTRRVSISPTLLRYHQSHRFLPTPAVCRNPFPTFCCPWSDMPNSVTSGE